MLSAVHTFFLGRIEYIRCELLPPMIPVSNPKRRGGSMRPLQNYFGQLFYLGWWSGRSVLQTSNSVNKHSVAMHIAADVSCVAAPSWSLNTNSCWRPKRDVANVYAIPLMSYQVRSTSIYCNKHCTVGLHAWDAAYCDQWSRASVSL